jgi:type I restriction enzyme S subunit
MTYPLTPLGEVLTQDKDYIAAPEAGTYPKLSVKLYGRGVELDTPTDGTTLKMQRHQLAKAGQVILSEIWGKKGAIGLVPTAGAGALCTSHFFLFWINNERALPGYLSLIFQANYLEPQLGAGAFGSTGYAAVRPAHLLAATIPLPAVEEQRRIVARVDAIACRATEARRLRDECANLLSSAFRAALTCLFADHITSGTLADVLNAPPRNGWSARCDGLDSGTPVLALSAVTGYRYRSAEIKRTSEPTSATADYWLRPGDVLITRSNTPALVGHAAIYDGTPAPCIYPDLMMRLDLNKQRVEPRFLIYWLQTSTVRDFIDKHAKGTSPTMKKISQGPVQRIPFPSQLGLSDQERIVAHLDALQAKLDAVRAEQQASAAELDALLPSVLNRAFAGQL